MLVSGGAAVWVVVSAVWVVSAVRVVSAVWVVVSAVRVVSAAPVLLPAVRPWCVSAAGPYRAPSPSPSVKLSHSLKHFHLYILRMDLGSTYIRDTVFIVC